MSSKKFIVTPKIFASKEKRFANYIIDYFVQIGFGFILGIVMYFISELIGNFGFFDSIIENESRLSDYVFGLIILLIYYTIIETLTERSIGKYITKTKIVMEDGSKPSFGDITIRSLCRCIPFEQFSFLGKSGRGWHDTLSKTYVVEVKKFENEKATFNEIDEIGKRIEDA